MNSTLTALAVAGLMAVSQAATEKSLRLTPQALAGTWWLRSGGNAVTIRFGPRSAAVVLCEHGPLGKLEEWCDVKCQIDREGRAVKIGHVAAARLVSSAELRVSFREAFLWVPKGAVLTLGKRMAGDGP
jgi:hypothetical protein